MPFHTVTARKPWRASRRRSRWKARRRCIAWRTHPTARACTPRRKANATAPSPTWLSTGRHLRLPVHHRREQHDTPVPPAAHRRPLTPQPHAKDRGVCGGSAPPRALNTDPPTPNARYLGPRRYRRHERSPHPPPPTAPCVRARRRSSYASRAASPCASLCAAARHPAHRYRSSNAALVGGCLSPRSPKATTRGCISPRPALIAISPLIHATCPREPQPAQTSSVEAPIRSITLVLTRAEQF